MENGQVQRYDIFCSVVDNFGDIGICWRLARQLASEHGLAVTLWVDDLGSFQRICPSVEPGLSHQQILGVTIQRWDEDMPLLTLADAPDVLIEALACTVPAPYLQQLATLKPHAVWLNLEYLSAESWVEGCHGLASPQSDYPLAKYFFFPGFNPRTGGLLREQTLIANLEAFQADTLAQQRFWQSLGFPDISAYQLKISLFCYDQVSIAEFVEQLRKTKISTLLLVPEGRIAEHIRQLWPQLQQQEGLQLNSLHLVILPFIPQQQYDYLLAACDINFVRGEDSIIRAQWAAQPFIWQIYRQAEQAHHVKLSAFLAQYLASAPVELATLLQTLHQRWDEESPLGDLWPALVQNQQAIRIFNQQWRLFLSSQQDLATNLVRFAEKKFIMPRNFS